MLPVNNDWEAVVSHKGKSHHAISDLRLVNRPAEAWVLPVSNDWEAVVSQKGKSHHAISDLRLVNFPGEAGCYLSVMTGKQL